MMLVATPPLLDWLNSEVSESDPGDVVAEVDPDDDEADEAAVEVVTGDTAEMVVTIMLLVQATHQYRAAR
ncbi:MAG TPA: hypothetical protein VMU85_22980 [Stellaceae bacterium]|nr:hypothetical protein [Stellaceae bacterium]